MALLTAAIIDAVSTDADALRRTYQMLAGGFQGAAADADLKVTAGAGMVSQMAAGRGLINGTQNTVTQGAYGVTNDATISQTHAASDPTNPRNDLVGIKIEDAFYSGSNKQATPVIVTGTPAASPVDPTPPANWLPLARVRVNAGSSSLGTITDLRVFLSSANHIGRYHAEAWQNSAQSFPNATATVVAYDSVEADPSGLITGLGGTSFKFNAPVPGRYLVTASHQFATATANSPILSALKNGSTAKQLSRVTGASITTALGGATVIRCTATGDYIQIAAYQDSGGSLNSSPGQTLVHATFTYLGPL